MKHEMFDNDQSEDPYRTAAQGIVDNPVPKKKKVKVKIHGNKIEEWAVTKKGQLFVRRVFQSNSFIGGTLERFVDYFVGKDSYQLFLAFLGWSFLSIIVAACFLGAVVNGQYVDDFVLEPTRHIVFGFICWWGGTLGVAYMFGHEHHTAKEIVHGWARFHIYGAILTGYGILVVNFLGWIAKIL